MRRGPRLFFSFRSPFSWMAITKLERSVPDLHSRVEFIPYWEPDERTRAELAERGADLHYAQMSKAKHLYVLYDTRREAARLGLRIVWPVDIDPWWELPHLAWLAARRMGRAAEFYTAVMAARWEHGEDVCEAAVVRELARQVGLDPDRLVGATEVEDIRAEGVDCLYAAYDDDIFGVPYFRIRRERYWGLDRVDDFIAELGSDEPRSRRPATAARGERVRAAVDNDSAGGCG
ncbi:disulfide bond formation protein DsbA [Solihabitans fulvus]|uniref:2-hydroxychromene-2-carboxylate isomerase n=1 Tax=Solihabitans fulvus TaxID=1892852 RepID=A0A5B2XQW4_9PSEU|nr:DsbA family protein [Solihabitans fulvus]KAA2265813.1 disulfide bond formation protein DsbA [Solihabitans fulvus]